MSEPIPEAIPTSADARSRRPVKRARTGNTAATTSQADEIENLMWDPSRPVELPALSSTAKSTLAPPPEIVSNVQGSSAGAGSGEFHVYKASRRRENERLRAMDEEAKKEEDDEKWEREERERKEKDEEKTKKNREKRNKRKKGKGKDDVVKEDTKKTTNGIKKNVDVPKRRASTDEANGNDFAVAEIVKENGITIHDDD